MRRMFWRLQIPHRWRPGRLARAAAGLAAPHSHSAPQVQPAPHESGEARLPGETFRDCPDCVELVVVPAGDFQMGTNAKPDGAPIYRVAIKKDFAIGRREVTFAEWDRCVAAGGCKYTPPDPAWGRGDEPVTNLSWDDAKEFIAWLAKMTGQALSAADRSRMGICRAWRLNPAILVG